MTTPRLHTSDARLARKMWKDCGGSIISVRRTGEVFYRHPLFASPLRVNDRRHDVPGKLMSRINQAAKAISSSASLFKE